MKEEKYSKTDNIFVAVLIIVVVVLGIISAKIPAINDAFSKALEPSRPIRDAAHGIGALRLVLSILRLF